MPLLGDRGETKIILKTATKIAGEEVWVKISKAILAEDVEDLDEQEPDAKKNTYRFLSHIITEWNLNLKDGSIAPITVENIKKLPAVDLANLQHEVNFDEQLSGVKKKNSSSTSPTKEKTE